MGGERARNRAERREAARAQRRWAKEQERREVERKAWLRRRGLDEGREL